MRNKHANTCQRLQPGMEESVGVWADGGGGESRGGNNIRSKEITDLNHVTLEFTFEFH